MRIAPQTDTTHLYLVRHGATPANEQRPYILQGRGIDLPLSETGEKQVQALGRFLSDFPLTHVYCSVLRRARQTAEAIAAPHGLPAHAIESLCECHVGLWEGMDWETIRREHRAPCDLFHENPAEHPYLGGESYADVHRRVQPVIQELLERHAGESIAI